MLGFCDCFKSWGCYAALWCSEMFYDGRARIAEILAVKLDA